MHNNYFLLRQLASELDAVLKGARLIECFSQKKEELIFVFEKKNLDVFYIQAHLTSQFSTLHFPLDFRRAKNNTFTVFEEVALQPIVSVGAALNERAFVIYLKNDFQLIFKLFGNHANVVLCKSSKAIQLLKKGLSLDWNLSPKSLDRAMDTTFEVFSTNEFSIKKTVFTLGNLGEQYLQMKGIADIDDDAKYKMLSQLLIYLGKPLYYITKVNHKVVLSLFEMGDIISTHQSAIAALSAFYHAHFRYNFLENHRTQLLLQVNKQLISTQNYIAKCTQKLLEHSASKPVEEIANIIMANLHQIPEGSTQVTLFDFYTNENISIALNRKISPQQYAAVLYKKSKNKHLALGKLQEQIEDKESMIKSLQKDKTTIEAATNYKEIEKYISQFERKIFQPTEDDEPVFKTYECMGFQILVGRNAKNNDTLTQKFAHKDDLWLHAKDVAGSHVVVKHQSGKPFPKPVLERAAKLAAYYSKRKNDSLCPVAYTLKKYVRKVKGAAEGAVRVEREQVIMVVPSGD